MESFPQILAAAQHVVLAVSDFIIGALSGIDFWIRDHLTVLGMPVYEQTMIVAALAVLVVIMSIRMLQGFARSAFIVVLLLLAMRVLMPTMQG